MRKAALRAKKEAERTYKHKKEYLVPDIAKYTGKDETCVRSMAQRMIKEGFVKKDKRMIDGRFRLIFGRDDAIKIHLRMMGVNLDDYRNYSILVAKMAPEVIKLGREGYSIKFIANRTGLLKKTVKNLIESDGDAYYSEIDGVAFDLVMKSIKTKGQAIA